LRAHFKRTHGGKLTHLCQHQLARAPGRVTSTSVPPGTIWWIRRDLRLHDNHALAAALARGGPLVPLFVRDPALLDGPHRGAEKRCDFLWGGLAALDRELRARGSRLVVRTGRPDEVLPAVLRDAGASAVVAEEEMTPYGRRRDDAVGAAVPLDLVAGAAVHHPRALRTAAAAAYTVFSPFRRAWLARGIPTDADLLPAPPTLPSLPSALTGEALPPAPPPGDFPPGESAARSRLAAFTGGPAAPIQAYGDGRNRVDLPATSALSPYLRFGMVSARAAAAAARASGADPTAERARSGPDVWLSELVWREFYQHVLWHFPAVLSRAFDPRLRRLAWRDAPGDLAAWQAGRTGYPIVDAAMRQLAASGWMHNRARMIVASFLTKDLLVDWRLGERWFMRHLVDGDPAANNGGWQWTAGVGTDAAPYFRVFNPVLQATRCDPEGTFVRRWVPELARVPVAHVHAPWRLSPLEQAASGCRIGHDYPAPIVDHAAARARALAAFRTALDHHTTKG
jgi:deoxyribodipyrimidine photo-lyase